jgi:Fungal Zn(2)-Cys(6) binuclear cluster domain
MDDENTTPAPPWIEDAGSDNEIQPNGDDASELQRAPSGRGAPSNSTRRTSTGKEAPIVPNHRPGLSGEQALPASRIASTSKSASGSKGTNTAAGTKRKSSSGHGGGSKGKQPANKVPAPPPAAAGGDISAAGHASDDASGDDASQNDDDDDMEGEGSSQHKSKRKRVYRACEVCRRKKIRCDAQKPCQPCECSLAHMLWALLVRVRPSPADNRPLAGITYGEDCHYLHVRDRSAYSKRYVEGLEHRLNRMEQALTQAIANGTLGGGGGTGNAAGAQSASPPPTMTRPPQRISTPSSAIMSPEEARLPPARPRDSEAGSPRIGVSSGAQNGSSGHPDRLAELAAISVAAQAAGASPNGSSMTTNAPAPTSGDGVSRKDHAATEPRASADEVAGGRRPSEHVPQQAGRLQYDEK